MFVHRSALRGPVPLLLLLLGLGAGLTPAPAGAQEREVLFSQITVSGAEASLALELEDGGELSVRFRDGRILVDGDEVGRYSRGDALERSWRTLLGEAVALEDGALARRLLAWSPPGDLEGDAARAARFLRERLEVGLRAPPAPPEAALTPAPEAPRLTVSPDQDAQDLLAILLREPDRLRELTAVVRDIRAEELRIYLGERVEVPEGETFAGALLVIDGDLVLAGTVEGDVVALGGRVELGEDARIGGDLRWAEARVEGNRNAVQGRIREIVPVADRPEVDLREEIRREVEEATARALQADRRRDARRTTTFGAFPRNFLRGLGGLFQTLVTFAILLAGGLAVLYFYPRQLEVVARTARNAPGRSAVVGLAGFVLAFPAWLIGLLVLVVSIIGIPVALLWIPAFPLAVALAVALGYLAVARNLGRWASGRDIERLGQFDVSRPAVQLGMGLALLLGAFALGHVFQMGGPWFGVFRGLLVAAGTVLTAVAACVGLGAVLLSRGGRDPAFAGPGWDWGPGPDPWAPEPEPEASAEGTEGS